ncbi:hypothetical protein Unana1_01262 [Umbelopsis nana]
MSNALQQKTQSQLVTFTNGHQSRQHLPPPADRQAETMEDIQQSPPASEAPSDGAKSLTDVEMNNLLTQIFVKIGIREKTKQGIVELYELRKRYPHAETKVNAYLSQTGNYFQSYIHRGLNNLSAEDDSLKVHTSSTTPIEVTDSSSVRSAESSSPWTSQPLPNQ